MTSDSDQVLTLVRRAGEALYGASWQSELARALGVTPRAVRNWMERKNAPRPDVLPKILLILRDRQDKASLLIEEIGAITGEKS